MISISNILNRYQKFINNYSKKNKLPFFTDKSLYYHNVPNDCHTNNYLENKYRYLKTKLGKHRVINLINFIKF